MLAYAQDDATDHFVLKVTTNAPSLYGRTDATDKSFTFYTQDTNYDIDWDNDGAFEATGVSGNQSYTFNTAGEHTIRFRNLNDVYINDQADTLKYTSIEQWGTAVWNADMSNAFASAVNLTMNPSAGTPDMRAVTNMSSMFRGATAFNQDIGGWNTAQVTHMSSMFSGATAFNQDIGNWNTAQVTRMGYMFSGATSFNQNIGGWNTAQVTTMWYMFRDATSFNQNIGGWNTAQVTTMWYMFRDATSFNQNIGGWNTAQVTRMWGMFQNAISFDQDIGGWNTAKVTHMSAMFHDATSFNQDIGNWNTAQVTHMSAMFSGFHDATSFNQDISGWNTAQVTRMRGMFREATAFDQDIGNWNTAQVTDMSAMFQSTTSFNQDIGNWNTAQVTDMSQMFAGATSFSQDIRNWNTARVTNMWRMFFGATSFNQNIGGWNTAQVTDMPAMFWKATSFNQDIGGWNTAKVTHMSAMFRDATAFDQNIGGWNVEAVTTMTSMFSGVALSVANYDALLTGWNAQNLQPGVTFHGGNSLYRSTQAQTARENMISSDRWSITDRGLRTMNQAPTNLFLSSTSIAENTGANAVVGMLSNTDTGGTYAYTLVTGDGDADNRSVNILGTSLRLTASADYEARFGYSIRINVSDGTHNFSKSFLFHVEDVNEAPVANNATFVVAENSANGTAVGTVTATDPDQPSPNNALTYAITGGNTGDVFTINPTTGEITVAGALDYETTTSYSLMVTVTDGGSTPLSDTATFTITVTDVNEYAPVFAGVATAVSYAENATTAVTTVTATDADEGQIVTFTLSGDDAGRFSITQADDLTFNRVPDFEIPTDLGMNNVYEVTITATDGQTSPMTATQALTITVTDEDDNTPVFTSSATENVLEGTTAVITVTATDADAGQVVSVTLTGGADMGLFTLSPTDELMFNTAPDFEMPTDMDMNNEYEVTVTATDNGTPAMTATQTLSITVTDENDNAPTFARGTTMVEVLEGTMVATTLTATDADAGQTVTFLSTLSGADAGLFSITSAGVLTFKTAPDYENPGSASGSNVYTVTVTATDGQVPAQTTLQTLTITVTDVENEHAPVFTSEMTED